MKTSTFIQILVLMFIAFFLTLHLSRKETGGSCNAPTEASAEVSSPETLPINADEGKG